MTKFFIASVGLATAMIKFLQSSGKNNADDLNLLKHRTSHTTVCGK